MNDTPIRLLIADDNAVTRSAAIALLETGPRVTVIFEATNGAEAVRLVEAHRPDVVLMDVKMPLLNGIEATRNIRRCWPAIRVVVLTMYEGYRDAALAAGADEFLLKAGPIDELLKTVFEREEGEDHEPGSKQQQP